MIFFNDKTKISVFGESSEKIDFKLKDPDKYRNAVLFEALRKLPEDKRKEFLNSKEAKIMVEESMIDADVIERLKNIDDNRMLKITVCDLAKENEDPEWDELVECRIRERQLPNSLINKYALEAKDKIEKANEQIINKSIPEYFRQD